MQPTDLQLLLLNAAIATLGSGKQIKNDYPQPQPLLKSALNDQQKMSVLPQDGVPRTEMHECYVHTESSKDVMKLSCYRNTVGCITWVNITQNGWHGLLPKMPFKEYVCLNDSEVSRQPIGKCKCQNSKCSCYCIGSYCNNRERITSITEEYDNDGIRRRSLPNWATIMIATCAVIVAFLLLLLMFAVCGEVVTRRSRYSHQAGRNETEEIKEEDEAEFDELTSARSLGDGNENTMEVTNI